MKSSRSVATTVMVLIALCCLITAPLTWAEGPFDVDNSTGQDRSTQQPLPGDGQNDGDGEDVLRGSDDGGTDWYFGLLMRITLKFLLNDVALSDQTETGAMQAGTVAGDDLAARARVSPHGASR